MAALAVSNIQPLPQQLEAVYECFLREPRIRFLLADDHGAGKTIMAGPAMKELILRRAGDGVLIVTPANLRAQRARELPERFDLSFTQIDSGNYDARPNENPWDVYNHVIVSRDFLKSDRVREAFETCERSWAPRRHRRGPWLHALGQREGLHRQPELLTATPHSGRDASLWGPLRLLDMDAWGDRLTGRPEVNDRYCRKVPKGKVRDMAGNKLFKDRHPQTLDYVLRATSGTCTKR